MAVLSACGLMQRCAIRTRSIVLLLKYLAGMHERSHSVEVPEVQIREHSTWALRLLDIQQLPRPLDASERIGRTRGPSGGYGEAKGGWGRMYGRLGGTTSNVVNVGSPDSKQIFIVLGEGR